MLFREQLLYEQLQTLIGAASVLRKTIAMSIAFTKPKTQQALRERAGPRSRLRRGRRLPGPSKLRRGPSGRAATPVEFQLGT
jgi:hypothetical protein